jgi:flagellar assembly protein FliH
MAAPAKFLFDVDFAAGSEREPTVTVSEHTAKLAEAETAAHGRGYADAQRDADIETGRRIAGTLERIAAGIDEAAGALKAIEARLECEAVEVAVAVARKLAPCLIEREPFAEISALASGCFRELVAAPHIVVRVNEGLYAAAREKIDDVARTRIRRQACRAGRTHRRDRRLPDRMGGRRCQSRHRRRRSRHRRSGRALHQCTPQFRRR